MRSIIRIVILLACLPVLIGCGKNGGRQDDSSDSPQPERSLSETHPPAVAPVFPGAIKDAEKRIVTWLEQNPGDYNRDGAVNGLDVFPLAAHFNEHSNFNGFLQDSPLNDCIDGNADGTLTGMDLFVISVNFNSEVTGYNLYKSTNAGADWTLVEGSPFARRTPASFMCRDRGRYDDYDGWFEPAWYYVTTVGGSESKAVGETEPSDIVTDEQEEIITTEQDLTGSEQLVLSGLGFGVHFAEAVAGEGDTATLGFVNNMPELESIPVVGQAFFADIDTGGAGEHIVRMPFLPRDMFGIEPGNVGLMAYQPEAKAPGAWSVLDPADYEIISTGDGEGRIELTTDISPLFLGIFEGGELRGAIHGVNLSGEAPLRSRFSCAARGGVFPYTYTWLVDDEPVQTGPSHRLDHTFDTRGSFEVACRIEDQLGAEITTDLLSVEVEGALKWVLMTLDDTVEVDEENCIAFDNEDNPAVSYLNYEVGQLKFARYDGLNWNYELLGEPGFEGYRSSLKFDSSGNPAIAYPGGGALRLVRHDGDSWDYDTVDPDGGDFPSLALDSGGLPSIAYRSDSSQAAFAWYDGAAWNREVLDDDAQTGWYASLDLDPAGNPGVGYYNRVVPASLNYLWWNGSSWDTHVPVTDSLYMAVCPAGFDADGMPIMAYLNADRAQMAVRWDGLAWQSETLDDAMQADYCSMAFDSAGHPWIVYSSWQNEELKLARWNGTDWAISVVAEDPDYLDRPTLALDSSDNPAVAYRSNRKLKLASAKEYLNQAPHDFDWSMDVVQAGLGEGCDPSMLYSWRVGSVQIAYHDPVEEDLMLATDTGSAWETFAVEVDGDTGVSPSLGVGTTGYPHIAYWNRGSGTLEYAWTDGSDWFNEVIDTLSAAAGEVSLLVYNNRRFISYHDADTGSLRLAFYEEGSGWDTMTVEDGGGSSHGFFNAVDNYYLDNSPRICYRSEPEGVLKFAGAVWDDAWVWTIDTIDASGDSGRWLDLEADRNVYAVSSYGGTDGDLRVGVYRDGWNFTSPDTAGSVGQGTACAWDDQDQLFVSYYDLDNQSLRIAWLRDGRWYSQEVSFIGDITDPRTEILVDGSVLIACYSPEMAGLAVFEGDVPSAG